MTDETPTEAPNDAPDADPLGKVVRIGQLLDLYGGLLTERQRTFIQLHYEDDLSFGEVARTYGVSRQAIHDAVKHAEKSLEEYEEKLRLLDRGISRAGDPSEGQASREEGQAPAPAAPVSPALEAAARETAGQLREMEDRLRRSGGIIYNAEGVVRQLGDIAARLESALPAS